MLQSIRDGDRLIVRIDGELDHFCAQSVRRDLDALLLDRSVRTLILDFSSLTFMDSSGIGVVLGRYRLLCLRGGSVALMHLTPQVRRIYDLSGMAQIIPVIEEKEAQGCN